MVQPRFVGDEIHRNPTEFSVNESSIVIHSNVPWVMKSDSCESVFCYQMLPHASSVHCKINSIQIFLRFIFSVQRMVTEMFMVFEKVHISEQSCILDCMTFNGL